MKQDCLKTIITLIGAALILFGSLQTVAAIGPGTGGSRIRVDSKTVGPFILLIATSPLPVTLDQQMSVWVRVSDSQTEELQRDATVWVEVTHRETGKTLTEPATHQNAGNDYDYVAHFDIEEAGQWDITVRVEDALGEGEISFIEDVSRGLSTQVLVILGIPFVVLAIVAGIYLWRRSASPG